MIIVGRQGVRYAIFSEIEPVEYTLRQTARLINKSPTDVELLPGEDDLWDRILYSKHPNTKKIREMDTATQFSAISFPSDNHTLSKVGVGLFSVEKTSSSNCDETCNKTRKNRNKFSRLILGMLLEELSLGLMDIIIITMLTTILPSQIEMKEC